MTPNYATLAAAQAAQAAATNAALAIARQQQQTQHQPTGGHASMGTRVLEGGVTHRVLDSFISPTIASAVASARGQAADC